MARDSCLARITAGVAVGGAIGGAVGIKWKSRNSLQNGDALDDIAGFLVSQLDHADLLEMQFEIGLKRFFVFGESTEDIFHIMKNSLSWDPSEQHKLWGLIRSELSVSKVQLEKIILKFFCSTELDANTSAIAVGGLLTLCICHAPTPELVGAIMLLPDDVFQDFAATVLASWVVSNASKLFDSLTKFSEKFDNENGNVAGSVGIIIEENAIIVMPLETAKKLEQAEQSPRLHLLLPLHFSSSKQNSMSRILPYNRKPPRPPPQPPPLPRLGR
ncbi:hypothetical protein NC651_002814 [Populus alba x Populus x berolinensis]|nr:hypothetical protein NC651_002814 [Populus alba x Populus x berolinensis]